MRGKLTRKIVLPVILVLGLSACQSFTTSSYRAEKATADLVSTLMQEEAFAHQNGQVTDAFHAQVKAAYEKYQAAGVAYALAVQGYEKSKDQATLNAAVADFTQALTGLLQLIQPKK